MTAAELRSLVVGDRVRLTTPGGDAHGVVESKMQGVVYIRWDEHGGKWSLNPRAKFDRERALNLSRASDS